jgi:hypothetical protein
MTRNAAKHDALLDELLKDYTDPKDILGEHGLLRQLTKRLVERALEAERTAVVRKNSLLMPLDDIPSTCDNKYEGIPPPVVEGPIGYDTMSTLAPHVGPDHWHARDTVGR